MSNNNVKPIESSVCNAVVAWCALTLDEKKLWKKKYFMKNQQKLMFELFGVSL